MKIFNISIYTILWVFTVKNLIVWVCPLVWFRNFFIFSKKVLKAFIFKYIIKIDDSKYNANMLYDELDIFRLIEE